MNTGYSIQDRAARFFHGSLKHCASRLRQRSPHQYAGRLSHMNLYLPTCLSAARWLEYLIIAWKVVTSTPVKDLHFLFLMPHVGQTISQLPYYRKLTLHEINTNCRNSR